MIFFSNLEDFSNILKFLSQRSIKLPIDLHYRPLEQTSILASEFNFFLLLIITEQDTDEQILYFFEKVRAFLDDILTWAAGEGQNII